MCRRHTLFSACEKYTNGMRIGSVMLRWTSSVVGISQNGASTRTAGTATRSIIRRVAPLPARSRRTQSRIESGSRAPAQYRTNCQAFGVVRAVLLFIAEPLKRSFERGHDQRGHATQGRLKNVEKVKVAPPQRDSPVVHLEHAANPELQPQRADNQR